MKKIILLIVVIVFFNNTFAQTDYYTTIKTPTNISIEAIYRVEYSSNDLAQIEADAANWISSHSSNAVRVAPASRSYNCHSYAWHYSDGGNKVWINQVDRYDNPNISKYWSGQSPVYQTTTSLNATKAFYPNGDHSAKVITATSFKSKWGSWPVYSHTPSDCPYTSTDLQYYYIPINGNNTICNSEQYSTININGATYDWNGNKISFVNNGYTAIATKILNGSDQIVTEISSLYSGTTVIAKKIFG